MPKNGTLHEERTPQRLDQKHRDTPVRTQSQTGHTLGGDSGGPLIVGGRSVGVLSTSSILPPQNPSDYTKNHNYHASIARNLSWITSISGVSGSQATQNHNPAGGSLGEPQAGLLPDASGQRVRLQQT